MLDAPVELQDTPIVRRSSVILVVAAELGIKGFLLLVHWFMAVLLAPFGDLVQAPSEPFTHRPHMDREPPFSAVGTDVRETEKVKRAGLSSLPFCLPHR